jgi:hypothetical protein
VGIAGHAQKGVVGVHNLLTFVDKDPDHVGVHQDICTFLTLAQGFLRPFLLVDVGTGAKPLEDLAGGSV